MLSDLWQGFWAIYRHFDIPHRALNRLARALHTGWCFTPPRHIWIEPTTRCNLRCRTCPLVYFDIAHRDIDQDIVERVKRQLIPYVRAVDLIGLGEPFLARCFPDLIRVLASRGIRISVTTNLTVWRPDLIEMIMRAGGELVVSLDGATAAMHESIRVGSNFAQICDRLINLSQRAREIANPRFEFRINFVVMRRNVAELEQLVRFAAKHGVGHIMVFNFGVGQRSDEFARESLVHHPGLAREYFPRVRRAAQQLGVKITLPVYSEDSAAPRVTTSASRGRRGRIPWPQWCWSPWVDTYIDIDGGVRACCLRGDVLGNLRERPFAEIWNGPKYRELRLRVNSDDPPEYCKYCNLPWGITGGDENWYPRWLKTSGTR